MCHWIFLFSFDQDESIFFNLNIYKMPVCTLNTYACAHNLCACVRNKSSVYMETGFYFDNIMGWSVYIVMSELTVYHSFNNVPFLFIPSLQVQNNQYQDDNKLHLTPTKWTALISLFYFCLPVPCRCISAVRAKVKWLQMIH